MKMNTQMVEVNSNLSGEKVRMGISEGAEALIMRSLSRLYSDPEGAVVREYSTNARDATIEAGKSTPIEVTTPTAFSPFFKVRDYGIGLTVDDIHTIYSQYGASTKRGSNEFNGQLGYGCKSALAYCDQFTVVSTKNGVTVTVVVAREQDGGGTMTVLDTSSTGEKDGTEIQVPAHRDNAMLAKAETFFSTWPQGTVLLNGKVPKRFEGLRITDDIYVIEGDQSFVVMGGVTYPAEFDLPNTRTDRQYANGRWVEKSTVNIMAFVPIGDVDFVPSREALELTDVTRATLDRVGHEFGRGIKDAIQREVDASATPSDAVSIIIKWAKYIAGNTLASAYTYKGIPLPASFKPPQVKVTDHYGTEKLVDDSMQVARFRNYGRTRSTTTNANSIAIHDWPTTVWVANYKPEKFTAQHKDKLRMWAANKFGTTAEARIDQFVMVYAPAPDSIFVDKAMIVEWEDIKAIKLPTNAPAPGHSHYGRIAGSFDIFLKVKGKHVEFKRGVPGDQIDQSKPIIWHNGNRWGCDPYSDLLAEHMDEFTLVCLPANRITKFCREVPAAQTAQAACDAAYKAWLAKLTKAQRNAVVMSDKGVKEAIRAIDPSKVKDPALKKAATEARIDVRPLQEQRRTFRRLVHMDEIGSRGWTNPLVKYPLYEAGHLRTNPGHTYSYLNLVHAGTLA